MSIFFTRPRQLSHGPPFLGQHHPAERKTKLALVGLQTLAVLPVSPFGATAATKTRSVLLITTDGQRWQEVTGRWPVRVSRRSTRHAPSQHAITARSGKSTGLQQNGIRFFRSIR
jgi:hypothetical protein